MAIGTSERSPEATAAPVSISTLPLSNRTRARLVEAGIESVAELAEKTDADLLGLEGFGHTCLREVRSALQVLDLGGAESLVRPEDDAFPQDLPDALLATPLKSLPIPNRARRVFDREGFVNVGDFVSAGSLRLMALRNFGSTTLTAVNRVVNAAARAMHESDAGAESALGDFEKLASDPRFASMLGTTPVAALDLPRRARRACQELGLRTLKDLARISSAELLTRRNFGQATLRRIQSELERFLRENRFDRPDGFASLVDQLLGRLQAKERRLIELREGRSGRAPCTLTEAGESLEITESRACQIEHAAWSKLRRFAVGRIDEASNRALERLRAAGGVAEPTILLQDAWFAADAPPAEFVARMLVHLLPHKLARLCDGRLVATPAATLATLAARLKKRLNRGTDSQPLQDLSTEVLKGLDGLGANDSIVRALCEVLFRREVTSGPDGVTVVRTAAQGFSDDLDRILREAGSPLHFSEITRRIRSRPYSRGDLNEEQVRLRLCRDSRFVLIRRGLYDLRDRFALEPSVKLDLMERAHAFLKSTGRPTSVALLASEARGEARFAKITEFVLATLLRGDARFRHLGRGTFVLAGNAERSVSHVSEILEAVLTRAGGPLSYAELKRRVREQRHVSDGAISATLVGRGTFLRIARGMFDLASRYPFDDAVRARVATAALERIDRDGGVASLDALATDLHPALKLSSRPSGVLIGDVLRRQGGFQFLGDGYVCRAGDGSISGLADRAAAALKSEQEPLRPTTLARRLGLSAGGAVLLKRVLRDDARFTPLADGRYSLA